MAEYLSDLETPRVVIDRDRLRQNIGRVRDMAAAHDGARKALHAETLAAMRAALAAFFSRNGSGSR